MKLDWDIMVRMHEGTTPPDRAWAEQAARDAAPSPRQESLSRQESRLQAVPVPLAIYTPYSPTGDLGGAYNRIMARLDPDEWAIFLDHDAMILTTEFWPDLQHAIATHPAAGAIVTWANRVGNPAQKAKCPDGDDLAQHTERARAIRAEYGQGLTDVSGPRMTGVCFAVSRAAWDKAGPFHAGFGEVDNHWAEQCQAAGLRLWRLDGVYVYHQRRTTGWRGGPRPELDCRGAAWSYARIAPLIAAHGDQTLRDLAAAHASLVESRGDWSECQKSARRKTLLGHWRASLRLSVVIPSREEDPDELAATVASFRDGGAHEILVIDDGSTEPVRDTCGADRILRHDAAIGVAASRNAGLAAATGNVIAFSDSHCRLAEGSLLDWAAEAYTSEDLLCAVCGGYGDDPRWYWGASLPWRGWRFDIRANQEETRNPAGVFGSVYGAARWTWDRVGGWVPTVGWGYNEQALSLACHRAAVPIRIEPWFRIRHRFRSEKRFPYPVSGRQFSANAPWTHWLLFGNDLWVQMRPAAMGHRPDAVAIMEQRQKDPQSQSLWEKYAGLRRATDGEVLAAVGLDPALLIPWEDVQEVQT